MIWYAPSGISGAYPYSRGVWPPVTINWMIEVPNLKGGKSGLNECGSAKYELLVTTIIPPEYPLRAMSPAAEPIGTGLFFGFHPACFRPPQISIANVCASETCSSNMTSNCAFGSPLTALAKAAGSSERPIPASTTWVHSEAIWSWFRPLTTESICQSAATNRNSAVTPFTTNNQPSRFTASGFPSFSKYTPIATASVENNSEILQTARADSSWSVDQWLRKSDIRLWAAMFVNAVLLLVLFWRN